MAIKNHYEISITTDIILFTLKNKEFKILLVKRARNPFKNCWALPGGFVKPKEKLKNAAKRELKEETGIREKDLQFIEQMYTFGNPKRDPRGRVVSVSYIALVDTSKKDIKLKASSDATNAKWFPVKETCSINLAFDHKKIINYALKNIEMYS